MSLHGSCAIRCALPLELTLRELTHRRLTASRQQAYSGGLQALAGEKFAE